MAQKKSSTRWRKYKNHQEPAKSFLRCNKHKPLMIKQPLLVLIFGAITFGATIGATLAHAMSAQQRFDLCRSVMDNWPHNPSKDGPFAKPTKSIGYWAYPPPEQKGTWIDLKCWEIPGIYEAFWETIHAESICWRHWPDNSRSNSSEIPGNGRQVQPSSSNHLSQLLSDLKAQAWSAKDNWNAEIHILPTAKQPQYRTEYHPNPQTKHLAKTSIKLSKSSKILLTTYILNKPALNIPFWLEGWIPPLTLSFDDPIAILEDILDRTNHRRWAINSEDAWEHITIVVRDPSPSKLQALGLRWLDGIDSHLILTWAMATTCQRRQWATDPRD